MHTIRIQNTFLWGIFLLFLLSFIPHTADAQYSGGGSAYRSKINKLDDDIVKNIPVPILLGVPLTTVTPNFGDPRDGGSRSHEGLDIMAPEGAPIVSPTEAVVIRTGSGSGSGKYVTTANPGGESFVYMHLSKILVKNGDVLKAGDVIGYVGHTGNASADAPHLHFEIRKSRKALDPYVRIKKEFTLKEKIDFLEDILKDSKEEKELTEFLLEEYLGTFYQARVQGITLPKNILKALPAQTSGPTGNLEVGDAGDDVMMLQSVLIAEGFLNIDAPTGTFGSLTQTALRKYQEAHGITPANGYFGTQTRTSMFKPASTPTQSTKPMTEAEMLAKITELTALIKQLQAQQGN